jgi:hypothetical protein
LRGRSGARPGQAAAGGGCAYLVQPQRPGLGGGPPCVAVQVHKLWVGAHAKEQLRCGQRPPAPVDQMQSRPTPTGPICSQLVRPISLPLQRRDSPCLPTTAAPCPIQPISLPRSAFSVSVTFTCTRTVTCTSTFALTCAVTVTCTVTVTLPLPLALPLPVPLRLPFPLPLHSHAPSLVTAAFAVTGAVTYRHRYRNVYMHRLRYLSWYLYIHRHRHRHRCICFASLHVSKGELLLFGTHRLRCLQGSHAAHRSVQNSVGRAW